MTGRALVLRANALSLPMPSRCVDLVVTSPPYFALRSYTDAGEHYEGQVGGERTVGAYVDALVAATREMIRVLKPSGSIWINLGDKYNGYNGNRGDGRIQKNLPRQRVPTGAGLDMPEMPNKTLAGIPWRFAIRAMDELRLILRAEVIWAKTNGMPEVVTDRTRRCHEQWFHFTLRDRYFANRSRRWDSVWSYATSTLRIPSHVSTKHYAAFPAEGPRRIIRGWCPEGGVVLDPFGGTGTTAAVARALGRTGISVDMSDDYCHIARWRTNDGAQLRKDGGAARTPEAD